MPGQEVNEMLRTRPLVSRTASTITDSDAFAAELEAVRAAGWAISFKESEIGIGAIAAPVIVDQF